LPLPVNGLAVFPAYEEGMRRALALADRTADISFGVILLANAVFFLSFLVIAMLAIGHAQEASTGAAGTPPALSQSAAPGRPA
jgi:hypothetical protein